MANIKEKVAYLQGLTQGLNVSDASSEGKLILNIIDVLDDMAEEIENVNMVHEDLEDYVETIDEDLTDLEEEVYEEVFDDDYVEVDCPFCHETVAFEAELLDDDDAVEVTCPHCGEVVYDNVLEVDAMDDDMDDKNSYHIRNSIHPGI